MIDAKPNKNWALSHRSSAGAQLTLEPHEVHRLKPVPPGICILSGMAWITWKGEDIFLSAGQAIQFQTSDDDPVISPVGHQALVIEMLQQTPRN